MGMLMVMLSRLLGIRTGHTRGRWVEDPTTTRTYIIVSCRRVELGVDAWEGKHMGYKNMELYDELPLYTESRNAFAHNAEFGPPLGART